MSEEMKKEHYELLEKEKYEEISLDVGGQKMLLYFEKNMTPWALYDGSFEITKYLRDKYKNYMNTVVEEYQKNKKEKEQEKAE